jgi:hypothetical protein
MKKYADLSGDSGIVAYDYGDDWIRIQFKRGGTYEYRSADIGAAHVANLKRLADSGDGLNTYISQNPEVRKGYSAKC